MAEAPAAAPLLSGRLLCRPPPGVRYTPYPPSFPSHRDVVVGRIPNWAGLECEVRGRSTSRSENGGTGGDRVTLSSGLRVEITFRLAAESFSPPE